MLSSRSSRCQPQIISAHHSPHFAEPSATAGLRRTKGPHLGSCPTTSERITRHSERAAPDGCRPKRHLSFLRMADKCGQSLPDLWVVAWRAIQDHARPFCTMKTGTARGFCETGHPTSGARQMRASGLSLVRQIRTNRRMRAYLSDLEPFVEQVTPIEHWPL